MLRLHSFKGHGPSDGYFTTKRACIRALGLITSTASMAAAAAMRARRPMFEFANIIMFQFYDNNAEAMAHCLTHIGFYVGNATICVERCAAQWPFEFVLFFDGKYNRRKSPIAS